MKLSAGLAAGVFACTAFAATPTYNKEIAPILYQNCALCHRPGEVAPFSLLTYDDARKRAALIAGVTANRYMPPWKAEPGVGHFDDERRLSDQQIALIRDWAKSGAPEGDPKDAPKPPQFAAGWLGGKPDAEIRMPVAFPIPADGRDVFQCFVLPLGFDADRFVKTVEFHPGNKKVVHHALFYLDTTGEARRLDAQTPEPGYPCFGGPRIAPSGGLGGWAPGATPSPLPAGVAHPVGKGADLVVQIHYHPDGKPETDQSALGLTFTEHPQKGLANLLVGPRNLDLPPGEMTAVTDWAVVPQDVELIGITPHAHWLCKEMKIDAHLPDGSVEPLIWIKDWDFNWQGQYRYTNAVKLPKGTRVDMRYTYDNTAKNPRNPSNPPKRVQYGEQTTDEMAFVFLQFALPSPDDVRGFRRETLLSRIEQMLINGDDFSGLPGRQVEMLRQGIILFDKNHNGKLEPEEREAFMKVIRTQIR
jgi:mono/diheme cytochrome c family protein